MAMLAIMVRRVQGLHVECLTAPPTLYRASAKHMMSGICDGDCVIAHRPDRVRAGNVAILEAAFWDHPMIFRIIATGGRCVNMLGCVPVIGGGSPPHRDRVAHRGGAGAAPALAGRWMRGAALARDLAVGCGL